MSLLEQLPRTFMVADLNNYYGNLAKLPKAMEEAMEHTMKPSYRTRWEFDRGMAQDVAEEYAEKVFYDWDCPSDLIWSSGKPTKKTSRAVLSSGSRSAFGTRLYSTTATAR